MLEFVYLYSEFQSAPPVWGATNVGFKKTLESDVSIRAPRVGSDLVFSQPTGQAQSFNPRPPCGERRGLKMAISIYYHVSIRAPRVGSDVSALDLALLRLVSIRAPRVGSDVGIRVWRMRR